MFLGYCEGTKAYRLMCVKTKRIIKSRDVMFLEGTKELKGVHYNRPPSNQIKHLVDEVVNDDAKDVNPIPLKEKLVEDVEGGESTSNSSSEEEFPPTEDEGLNEPQQDGRKERPQRRRKEWPHDWWVATKEVEQATIIFSKEPQTMEEALKGKDSKKWEIAMQE